MGGPRGRLIGEQDRARALDLIDQACRAGARKGPACEVLGLSVRSVQRWQCSGLKDRRKGSRATPANALSDAERRQIISLLVCPRYQDLNPNQLVPQLADRGLYLGSESTLYRLLREQKMNRHRAANKPATHHRPRTHVAGGPNQVWTWDISYLPTCVAGVFLYLYLIVDICSRKIVAWQVHDHESQQLGAALVSEACFLEHIGPEQITLHSDNGSPMKGATMLATLHKLGIMPSFSRPSVSNDNPFSESLFRTLKYRPEYPERPFVDIDQARAWVEGFVAWYNTEHLHSGIRFIRPVDRHSGKEKSILKKRHAVYQLARKRHPERWSGNTRNWSPVGAVVLNKTNQSEKQINKAA